MKVTLQLSEMSWAASVIVHNRTGVHVGSK